MCTQCSCYSIFDFPAASALTLAKGVSLTPHTPTTPLFTRRPDGTQAMPTCRATAGRGGIGEGSEKDAPEHPACWPIFVCRCGQSGGQSGRCGSGASRSGCCGRFSRFIAICRQSDRCLGFCRRPGRCIGVCGTCGRRCGICVGICGRACRCVGICGRTCRCVGICGRACRCSAETANSGTGGDSLLGEGMGGVEA